MKTNALHKITAVVSIVVMTVTQAAPAGRADAVVTLDKNIEYQGAVIPVEEPSVQTGTETGALSSEHDKFLNASALSVAEGSDEGLNSEVRKVIEVPTVETVKSQAVVAQIQPAADPGRARLEDYYKKLGQFDKFMSGVAREGVTIEEILAARNIQVQLREALQAMIDNGEPPSRNVMNEFSARLTQLDETLARNPLVIRIGNQRLEVNISEAARVIAEEYRRLTGSEGIDYDRLPGVDPADLEGHETFADYLAFRQVGVTTTIPVFRALSSYGNATFIYRMIQKYGTEILGGDLDGDKILEINFTVFRRFVNGTEQAYRQGAALINEIMARHPIAYPAAGVVSLDALKEIIRKIDALHSELTGKIAELVNGLDVEKPFEDSIRYELDTLVEEKYQPVVRTFRGTTKNLGTGVKTIVDSHNIQFPAGNTISYATLNEIAGRTDALNEDLTAQLREFLAGIEGVEVSLKNHVYGLLDCEANGCYESYYDAANGYRNKRLRGGWYQQIVKQLEDAIWYRNVLFQVEGAGEVLTAAGQLNVMTSDLPASIISLLRFPGIQEKISGDQLGNLEKLNAQVNRARIDLNGRTGVYPAVQVSSFALRIQLTQLMLEAYPDKVIKNGRVDVDAYRRALLMSEHLELLFDSAKAAIQASIQRAGELAGDGSQGITPAVYARLYDLIKDTHEAVVGIMKLALDNVIYEARSLVTGMLQEEFNRLLSRVDAITGQSKVVVEIRGTAHVMNARDVQNLVHQLLKMVTLNGRDDNTYTKEQLGRLNGITPAMLENLKSDYELGRYRQLNFNSYNPSFSRGNQVAANQEFWFQLVPAVLQGFGSFILDGDGKISLARIEDQLLDKVELPVNRGEELLEVIRLFVNERIAGGRAALDRLDFSVWEQRIQGRSVVLDVIRDIQDHLRSLIQHLNVSEIERLKKFINYGNYDLVNSGRYLFDSVDRLRELHGLKLMGSQRIKVIMNDGISVEVDLNLVAGIPGFPWNRKYDKELFPGIIDSDFNETESTGRWVSLVKKGTEPMPDSSNFFFDREKLMVNIIRRQYGEQAAIPELFRNRLFQDRKLNVEIFRRIIKGVDVLHQTILDTVKGWTAEELPKIKALETEPMTIESIRAVYAAVGAFQQKLLGYMEQLTQRHEREDVIEMEESVTAIYKAVIDEMIPYLRTHHLVVVHEGHAVVIPVAQISGRLLEIIRERHPNEDLGAHHFASFFGITVDRLRAYNKLEAFLGLQIIALPRNSQYIEIVSKLSEIGMMELVQDAVARYAGEVIHPADRTINIDRLIELLMDAVTAIENAKKRADEIVKGVTDRLSAIEMPLTSESFKKIVSLMEQGKLELVNAMNDAISGFTPEMTEEVQAHVSGLYDQMKALRDQIVTQGPVRITAADGTVFDIPLTGLAPAVEARILEILANLPPAPSPKPWPIPDENGLIMRFYDGEETVMDYSFSRSMSSSLPPVLEAVYLRSYRPWYPLPDKFDPADRPTQFGFFTLIVRLAEKYGSFVVDDGGRFSAEQFLVELGRTDANRARERFEKLQREALAELRSRVPEAADRAIALDDIVKIHAYLDGMREKFLSVLRPFTQDYWNKNWKIINIGNAAWSAVMDEYEKLFFSMNVFIDTGGKTLTANVKALVAVFFEESAKGQIKWLDPYLKGGETDWQYSDYRTLYQRYDYYYDYQYFSPMPDMADFMESESGSADSEPENPDHRYEFTLGDLTQIPGVSREDLAALDVESKDRVKLTMVNPRELLKGQLNMRVFAPGAAVQTVGNQVTSSSTRALFWRRPDPIYSQSRRDLLFRVVPALVRDFSGVLSDGENQVDPEKFRELLRDPDALRMKEQIKQIRSLVAADLNRSFGLSEDAVKAAFAGGLIKIDVDLKNLSAVVTINPAFDPGDLPPGAAYLVDLLGTRSLPEKIEFRLGALTPKGENPQTTYHLETGSFHVRDRYFELDYGTRYHGDTFEGPADDRLHTVKIYDSDPNIVCITTPCPTGKLIKAIAYGNVGDENFGVLITYHDGSQGEIASRNVVIERMQDGNFHIKHATDYDKDDKVLAENQFEYVTALPKCLPESDTVCPGPSVSLFAIHRTDKDGNALSEITDILQEKATITRARDGGKKTVTFKDLQHLLALAREFENEISHPERELPLIALGSETYDPNHPYLADGGWIHRFFFLADTQMPQESVLYLSRRRAADGTAGPVIMEVLSKETMIPKDFDGLNFYVRFVVTPEIGLDVEGVREARRSVRRLFGDHYNQTVELSFQDLVMLDLGEGGYTSAEYSGTWSVQNNLRQGELSAPLAKRIADYLKEEEAAPKAQAALALALGVSPKEILVDHQRRTRVTNDVWRRDDSLAEVYRVHLSSRDSLSQRDGQMSDDDINFITYRPYEADVFVSANGEINVRFTAETLQRIEEEKKGRENFRNAVAAGDLVVSFGFDSQELNRWVAEGKIRFAFEEGTKRLTARFDKSIQGKKITGSRVDPLGAFMIPAEVRWDFSISGLPMKAEVIYERARPALRDAFGNEFAVVRIAVEYDRDGRLIAAEMLDQAGKVLRRVEQGGYPKICRPDEACPRVILTRWADIKYKRAQADGIVRRRVNYNSAGQIESVEEFRLDALGNEVPAARNQFKYTPSPTPALVKIVREAPAFQVWKPVSVMTFPSVVKPMVQAKKAVISLPDGKKRKAVTYRTLEDLLGRAGKFDKNHSTAGVKS